MQLPFEQAQLFTVYQTQNSIELRSGCTDFPATRVIGTYKSYALAYDVAQATAKINQLMLINYVEQPEQL